MSHIPQWHDNNYLIPPSYLYADALKSVAAVVLALGVVSILCVLVGREIFKPLHLRRSNSGRRYHLPPGPSGGPIVGNLIQFFKARSNEVELLSWLSSLSRFGEMTTLHLGSKTWVFLNTQRVVDEIIAKRGSITHERPHMPIASGLVSGHNRFLLQRTARWTEARRVIQPLLSGSNLKTYAEWQELESIQLLAAYLYRPQQWYSHHYRYCVSVIHRIILGERLLRSTPELEELRRVITEFLICINGNYIDFFPQLENLPLILQFWRSAFLKVGQSHYDSFRTWWKPVREAIANDTAPHSFVKDVLLHEDTKYVGNDEQAMYVAMSTISAGSDNPRMTMNCFVMAALSYPQKMQKARDEIDGVCGSVANRLPGMSDMTRMPYVCALIKEILRWRPTVPMVPQHQLTEDLEFEGFLFPAGTEFVINGIAVSKDYRDPEVFSPERWLDGNEASVTHSLWHFGGGRRICVGYKVGQMELFLAFARLIYCFDYAAAGHYDNLRLRHSTLEEPFPVNVVVRSEEHRLLIEDQAAQAGVLESAKLDF